MKTTYPNFNEQYREERRNMHVLKISCIFVLTVWVALLCSNTTQVRKDCEKTFVENDSIFCVIEKDTTLLTVIHRKNANK